MAAFYERNAPVQGADGDRPGVDGRPRGRRAGTPCRPPCPAGRRGRHGCRCRSVSAGDRRGAHGHVVEPEGVVTAAVTLPAETQTGGARCGGAGQPLLVDVRGGDTVLVQAGHLLVASQVSRLPFDVLIMKRRHCQLPVGSGLLCATPAGLCAGRVASSISRFHWRAPFWPPMRSALPPWELSGMDTKATCPAGSAVVCRTHMRMYRGPTDDRSAVVATKAWLQ